MRDLCPHCGYNFSSDAPLVCGEFRITPQATEVNGVRVKLTPGEAEIFYAIAKGNGACIGAEALGNRFSDGENPAGVTRVFIRRLRMKLGANCPIETVWYHGYRWNGGQVVREAA